MDERPEVACSLSKNDQKRHFSRISFLQKNHMDMQCQVLQPRQFFFRKSIRNFAHDLNRWVCLYFSRETFLLENVLYGHVEPRFHIPPKSFWPKVEKILLNVWRVWENFSVFSEEIIFQQNFSMDKWSSVSITRLKKFSTKG